METVCHWTRVALLLLAAMSPARAGTWIVDQNGGPGVHFTDIPPAISAAVAGDVILVRGGTYSPFSLNKGLAIIGRTGAAPTGTVIAASTPATTITIPAGELGLLCDLTLTKLSIIQSAGVVVTDRVVWTSLTASQSADVRIHRSPSKEVLMTNSHFEIASSTLNGSFGTDAIRILGSSQGLVARTSCRGGNGRDAQLFDPNDAESGGAGISLWFLGQMPTLVLAGGDVSTIQGGDGGWHPNGNHGWDADGFLNYMSGGWRSGCTFIPGNRIGNGAIGVRHLAGPGSFDMQVDPNDPTLELVGTPSYGESVLLNVYATPGSTVRVNLGSPLIQPTPGVRVDKLVSPDSTLLLGVVPQSGVVSQLIYFRREFSPGRAVFAQAFMGDVVAQETRRTNSVPLIMR